MTRSESFIEAIAASTWRCPSALFLLARASAFSSWACALIAPRSSSVNPLDVLPGVVGLMADRCLVVIGLIAPPVKTLSWCLLRVGLVLPLGAVADAPDVAVRVGEGSAVPAPVQG